jgi:hypothetical protein
MKLLRYFGVGAVAAAVDISLCGIFYFSGEYFQKLIPLRQ